jgi:hypothetical protein
LLNRKHAHAFSLLEVQAIQTELRSIDSCRVDGKFISVQGLVVSGQAACVEIIELCFDDVSELLSMQEAVDGDNPMRETYESLIKIKAEVLCNNRSCYIWKNIQGGQ